MKAPDIVRFAGLKAATQLPFSPCPTPQLDIARLLYKCPVQRRTRGCILQIESMLDPQAQDEQ
jgi:hypothetical protein